MYLRMEGSDDRWSEWGRSISVCSIYIYTVGILYVVVVAEMYDWG
jgi:hypothetical protein